MSVTGKLSEIIWNNQVDEHYSNKAEFFRYGALAVIFAVVKWYCKLPTAIALIPAIGGSLLFFGLFMNRIRCVAAAVIFSGLATGYLYAAPILLKGRANLAFLNPEYLAGLGGLIMWCGMVLVMLGLAAWIGCRFFNCQFSRSAHHKLLFLVLTAGYGVVYSAGCSWLLLIAWFFGDVWWMVKFVIGAGVLIALILAKAEAKNIAWDLFIARNPFAALLDADRIAIKNALPAALKDDHDVKAMLTLAMKYAQCNGVMRNPQQCIRWCTGILDYLEGTSPEASLHNVKTGNMEKYLAHMLLYIVYSRSTKYKDTAEAEKHKNAFDHSKINNISGYWQYWSDPEATFEDNSAYRFFGMPYKELLKTAVHAPDAYLALVLYCSTLSKNYPEGSASSQKLVELLNKYMKLGIENGSKACTDFLREPPAA